MNILKEELNKSEDVFVKENILLLIIATSTNTKEGPVVTIDDHKVLSILANQTLSKNALLVNTAIEALRKLVLSSDLAPYHEQFHQALQNSVSEARLLLIAKAKVVDAKELVNQIAEDPEWKSFEATRIAQAALGNNDITNEYIEAAKTQHDQEKIEAFIETLRILSLIGTEEALKAIAGYLRTPLILDRVQINKKSVRLDVLNGLVYNFPDQKILYPGQILSAESYTIAEQFCIKQLGIEYTEPQPPFMTYIGYPSRRR